MPVATVGDEVVRKDLKSLPGGWVNLRALPFGQMLARRDKASKMSMQTGKKGGDTVDIATMQSVTRQFEFARCIVDHNLTDKLNVKLDFSNPLTLQALSPKVGGEIETYIDELNQPDEDLEPFTNAPQDSSLQEDEQLHDMTQH